MSCLIFSSFIPWFYSFMLDKNNVSKCSFCQLKFAYNLAVNYFDKYITTCTVKTALLVSSSSRTIVCKPLWLYYLFNSCMTASAQSLQERLLSLFIFVSSYACSIYLEVSCQTQCKQSPRRKCLPMAPSVMHCGRKFECAVDLIIPQVD